jgi:quercetin dioxygenase-like cupin family protein
MFETVKHPALWIFAAMSLYGQDSSSVKIDSPQARVLVVTEQPHQPIERHDGPLNRVLVYIDSGQLIDKPAEGQPRKIDIKAGDVHWSPAPGTHTSECVSDHPIRIVEVELKNASPAASSFSAIDPLKADPKHYSLVLENNQVRVLRVRFAPNEKGEWHEHTLNHIVVYLNDQARGKTGEVRLDEPMKHTEQNPLDHSVERIAIDLK